MKKRARGNEILWEPFYFVADDESWGATGEQTRTCGKACPSPGQPFAGRRRPREIAPDNAWRRRNTSKPLTAMMRMENIARGAGHASQCGRRPRGVRANALLDEAPGRLDRIEIMRVGRQIPQGGAALVDQRPDLRQRVLVLPGRRGNVASPFSRPFFRWCARGVAADPPSCRHLLRRGRRSLRRPLWEQLIGAVAWILERQQ